MGKSQKTKKKQVRVPKEYMLIERIWAEHGVVRIQMQDGTYRSLTIKDAAMRAGQLNAMPLPDWHRQGVQKLITTIIDACREAKKQIQDNTKSATMMDNMLAGKAADGRPLADVLSENQKIGRYKMQFHTLTEQEISAALRDSSVPEDVKLRVMRQTHANRLMDAFNEGGAMPLPAMLSMS